MQNIGPEGYQVHPKERVAITPYVDGNERFAGRYEPLTLCRNHHDDLNMPIILISDRRLLALTGKGVFGRKYNVLHVPFSNLRSGVARWSDIHPVYESKFYHAAVKTVEGDPFLFSFDDEREWDHFAATLEAMIIVAADRDME